MFVSRCRQRIKTTIFHFHIHLVLRKCLDPRIQCNLDCHSNYSALFLSLAVSLPLFPMPIFALFTAPFDSLFEVDNICSWSVFYLLKLFGLALFSPTILLILVSFFFSVWTHFDFSSSLSVVHRRKKIHTETPSEMAQLKSGNKRPY